MEIQYRCQCQTADKTLWVRDRQEDETIVHWIQSPVATAISEDHRMSSPDCRATTMLYIKVPVEDDAPHLGARAPDTPKT